MSQTSTRLIRRCICGNTLIVDVQKPSNIVVLSYAGKTVAQTVWGNIECVDSTCYLTRRRPSGHWKRLVRIQNLFQTNRHGFRAVFCRCGRVKHLSKFVVPQV